MILKIENGVIGTISGISFSSNYFQYTKFTSSVFNKSWIQNGISNGVQTLGVNCTHQIYRHIHAGEWVKITQQLIYPKCVFRYSVPESIQKLFQFCM